MEEKYIIKKDAKIVNALQKINDFSAGQALVLFVINDSDQIIGSLTDGDIRRGLLANVQLSDSVQSVMNLNFHYLEENFDIEKIKYFKEENLQIIPLVDGDKKIIKIINFKELKSILPLTAVIMAGGKGTRLRPYTDNIPKPLLELNQKPIIAHNIDRLISFGIKDFYISINHMKDQIIEYIDATYADKDIVIKYIEESKSLGTIGSVSLVDNFRNDDILVMNSDILTNIDFEDFYLNYKEHNDDMSIATFNVKVDIPYAVLETQDKIINSLIEKPRYTYYSNAGIYLFKKIHAELIPELKKYDSTDFMNDLIKKGKKVTHFPIRGYWLDIGNIENYRKAQDDIRYVKF